MEFRIYLLMLMAWITLISTSVQLEDPFVNEADFLSIVATKNAANGGAFEVPCNSWVWMNTEMTVTFKSPKYPSSYDSKQCQWLFRSFNTGDVIRLECEEFEVGENIFPICRGDALRVFSGRSRMKSFCGDDNPTDYKSTYYWAYALFQPTLLRRVEYKGFKCTATATAATSSPGSSSCKCGRKGLPSPGRVVGGTNAGLHEFPWQAALVDKDDVTSVVCGAVVINDRYVLTAAHCITYPNIPSNFRVVVGEHDRTTADETKQTLYRDVAQVVIHEDYDYTSLDNDIALIQLSQRIDLEQSDAIKPICLPDPNDSYVGKTATVTGWGLDDVVGLQPSILQKADVITLSNGACQAKDPNRNLTPNMLCAAADGKDSCQGDSGGPLIVADGNHHVLVGLVSHGILCANPTYPGIYVRVGNYIDWIKNNVGDAMTCAE